jgi:MFS family permease
MVPELTGAWNLSALGLYYYTYTCFSIIAGVASDRYGAKVSIPVGIACLAVGAAQAGRLQQGAGSAFAFVDTVYLAAHGFSARLLATVVGTSQIFGMLGGACGKFLISPPIHDSNIGQHFWLVAGAVTA